MQPTNLDNTEEFDDRDFRALNYLGSKLRIIDFIEKAINDVSSANCGVCDLFAGGGSVTYRLSRNRKVISSDIQEYSRVICSALTSSANRSQFNKDEFIKNIHSTTLTDVSYAFEPLIEFEYKALSTSDAESMALIIEDGSIEVYRIERNVSPLSNRLNSVLTRLTSNNIGEYSTKITRYYGGIYFSYTQAIQIDCILNAIEHVESEFKDICLAALLSSVSDIVNTVGKQFAQPLKMRDSQGSIKKGLMKKIKKDRSIDIFTIYHKWLEHYLMIQPGKETSVVRQDYYETLKSLPADIKIVYADPPYTRDHYSRYYHVLETIALQDMPALSTTNIRGEKHISRGIYRAERHQSPFCIRSKAPAEFEKMFKTISMTNRILLLSYSPYDETKKTHPRVVTIQQLQDIAKRYFASVEIISAGHFQHSKLTSTEQQLEASDMAELLIICQ